MLTAAGPLSMVIDVPLENVPNADTSTITVRGSPTPLLSVGVCTACTAIEYDSQPTPDTAHQVPPEIGFGRMRTRELAAMRSLDNGTKMRHFGLPRTAGGFPRANRKYCPTSASRVLFAAEIVGWAKSPGRCPALLQDDGEG